MKWLILEKYLDKVCPINRLKKRKDHHHSRCRKTCNKIQYYSWYKLKIERDSLSLSKDIYQELMENHHSPCENIKRITVKIQE